MHVSFVCRISKSFKKLYQKLNASAINVDQNLGMKSLYIVRNMVCTPCIIYKIGNQVVTIPTRR